MQHCVNLQDVPVKEVPAQEGHYGGRIQYVFTKDTVGSERLRLIVQEYDPGGYTVAQQHGAHALMEQAYYVIEGEMEAQIGDKVYRAGPGCCLFIPRNTLHAHRNVGKGKLRFLTLNCRWEDQ